MRKMTLYVLLLITTLLLAGCNTTDEDEQIIYVTVYPMQFLVEELAGDLLTVKRVPGSASHSESIDWSSTEIINMIQSDMIFYIGGGVDSYIPNNMNSTFKESNATFIDMSELIPYNLVCYTNDHDHSDTPEDETTGTCEENMLSEDPHFWLDPIRMKLAAEIVRDKLVVQYPNSATYFDNRFKVLGASLDKLHEDYQEMADAAIKPIITTSMLFTYWHERYDIEILALSASDHAEEEPAGDIIDFVEEAQFNFIHHILFEKYANSPAGDEVLRQLLLVDDTAVKLYLHGLGNLTNEERNNGSSYISIMYDNLEVLNTATK